MSSSDVDLYRTLDQTLERFELAAPVEIGDAIAVRDAVKTALPRYQVEAFHRGNELTVNVGLCGTVFATRTMRLV